MKHIFKTKSFLFMLIPMLWLCLVLSSGFSSFITNIKTSYASFKCDSGYAYFAGNSDNKNKPLPHNCTKIDEMVMVCENNYIEDPIKTCSRDLVVYKCPEVLGNTDFVIHRSIVNPKVSSIENTTIFGKFFQPIMASALFGPSPTTFLPDEYKTFGDLCTNVKYKKNFSVGNICNTKVFGDNPTSIVKAINLNSNGIPLPDEKGLVSYFNDLALKGDSKDYGKLKEDLFDLFNNDSSLYSNQLCQAPTKALRASITSTSKTPSCFFGIGCGPTKYSIVEAIADVADSCNIQTGTCKSILKCIRSIHKCEPQPENTTFPITDFTYYIGKEQKDDNGAELSNGRAVQFEPDYENLPQERTFLPNAGTTTICPNNQEWRPFFVAAKTDFKLYDTQLMQNNPVVTPYLCAKKGFNLKSAVTILRDASQDCGERTKIYADSASNDDSALLICTPPLSSTIKVPVCPGGTSIKILGDYTNVEGNMCYKSIAPEEFIIDKSVVGEPRCTPNAIKPNLKLKCIFNLDKENFAGYSSSFDFAKLVADTNFKLPTDTKYDSCTTLLPLTAGSNEDEIKKRNDEIYYNRIICIALISKVSNQKFAGHFVIDGEVRVKIVNLDGSNLASSQPCTVPSATIDGKIEYENLLVCENINIGETFSEGKKNVIVQIGDFNDNKGIIDAKLGGCEDGINDLYNCYKCLSGTKYDISNGCSQPGESIPTIDNPIKVKPNSDVPKIPLNYTTIKDKTNATLTFEGSSNKIEGTILNGGFVPNDGEKIPEDAKTGITTAVLEVEGKKVSIPTNIGSNNDIGAINKVVVEAKIGQAPPVINLPNNTLLNGTPTTFTPNGASNSIKGIIKDNQFVPDPGQTIPVGSTIGSAIGVIKTIDSTTGVLVNIQSTPELIKNIPFVRTGGAARK